MDCTTVVGRRSRGSQKSIKKKSQKKIKGAVEKENRPVAARISSQSAELLVFLTESNKSDHSTYLKTPYPIDSFNFLYLRVNSILCKHSLLFHIAVFVYLSFKKTC